ncbi:nucleoside triphosphate pyrophosphohydrolase [Longispora albida]|uniref:nucleoside triphosphate pyrophosphohydrolase n=1 Tax=Longispora albida TaxID=203523 RepID=UPI00036429B8|nr:nucleoside triphosphate pyrophosphohydrolase [Longispora albida]
MAKLVRDRIPEIIAASGAVPQHRTAAPEEAEALLRAKLAEETAEFLGSGEAEELADVLEVLHALAAQRGLTPADLEGLRAAKAEARGAFTRLYVWEQG